MTREEKLAYSRGYNAGSRGAWPAHLPPKPPDALFSRLQWALVDLVGVLDGELGKFDPDDPFVERLYQQIDNARAVLESLTNYVFAEPGKSDRE